MEGPSFLPFARPAIDADGIAAVVAVLASGWITSGPRVLEFETRLSALFSDRPVRAFANGTATMEVALRLAGIGAGDEVITTPITWVATANVIVATGARPVFVDVDPHTRNIDLDAVEAAITPRTRAIMPVYLAGRPVDMDRFYRIARRHGLRVVEDAAQAIDSRWKGQRIGSFGDLVSFSFHANLDGMDVDAPGGKSNLTDINAAIGLGQLVHLGQVTARRTELAQAYFEMARQAHFEELGIELPPATAMDEATPNWHMFQVLLPVERLEGGRAAVMQAMLECGIGTGVHYPAVHTFSYYRSQGWREGALPHADRVGRSILTLPLFPAMRDSDVERVCVKLADSCKRLLS
jgi:dTDP-4-amino-4,6-dideoxygalactose transaminase